MTQGRIGEYDTVGMMVRMPSGLRDRIKAAADANGRSQNSEILITLEEKYPGDAKLSENFNSIVRMMASMTPEARRKTVELSVANVRESHRDNPDGAEALANIYRLAAEVAGRHDQEAKL